MSDGELRIGVAHRDISPPRPELLAPTGMGRIVPTRGVLDPLRVEAMAIRMGEELAFIITSDLRMFPMQWIVEVREAVGERTGCDPRRVLFSAVHNHCSSPEPADDSPEAAEATDEANRKIVDALIDACVAAVEDVRPAEIASVTTTLTETVGENRRFVLGGGTAVNSWGAGPVIPPGVKAVGPAGPDSTRVDVLAAREIGASQPFAVLTSYATHPHLYELPYFSGEFPGAAKRCIEAALPGAVALHATHAGGNVDLHGIHPKPDDEPGSVAWFRRSADLLGQRLADAALPAIAAATYSRPTTLRHVYESTENLSVPGSRRLVIINGIALGDIGIVSIPGEMFIEFGIAIHAGSPPARTILIAYNGSRQGYVPPAIGFEQGSYEVMRGPSATVAEEDTRHVTIRARPETGDEIVASVLGVLSRLADGD